MVVSLYGERAGTNLASTGLRLSLVPAECGEKEQLVVLLVSLYTTRRWMLAKNGSRIVCLPRLARQSRGLTVKTVTDIV